MVDNELKKLKRKDLLIIILEQQNRIEKLEEELKNTNEKLNSRKIAFKELGTLAEASLQLSKIFEKADEAAKIYLENIELFGKKEERRIKKEHRDLKKKLEEGNKVKKEKLVKEKNKKHKINNDKKEN